MKKGILLLLFLGVIGWLFAASASWNYDTQTGNIGTTYSWIDASGGTDLGLSDDSAANVQWPFDFQIYDDNYTGGTDNISVCSNGYMRFDGAASTSYGDAQNYDLTSSATSLGQIICVGIYDDNLGDSNSHAYWTVTGTSPNRILTIEYQDLEINYNAGLYADIEVQFYEADKKIVMLFGDDNVTQTSADQGIHSGVSGYYYKWGDVDSNTNQTWLELTIPSNPGPGGPSNPNPADGAANVAVDNNPDISWDNPTGASYNYVYFGTDQTLVNNMDSSVQVLGDGSTLYTSYNQTTDLSYYTTYYWKVVEYDSSGNSTEGSTYSFTTVYQPQSVPYSTDFSSTDGWSQQSIGCSARWGTSSTNNAGGTSPEMHAVYENVNPATSRLISPPIITVGYDSLQLIFKHFYDAYDTGITIKIQTSTDLNTWTDEKWIYIDPTSNIGPETVTTSITHNMNDTTYVAWVLDGNLYNFDHWYVDDVTIQDFPSCIAPTAQSESNITTTSADLDWTEGGSATTWDIEWGPTGFTQGSGTTISGITSKPYTLSGLSANTTYDWYVRADCGGGSYSDWTGPSTFTTKCNTITTFPWVEEFTTWPPDCWDLTGGTDSWEQYSSDPVYCAKANYWGQAQGHTDIMTTPVFDISSLDVPILTFDWSHQYNSSYPNDSLSVEVSDDNGTTWNQVWSKGGTDLDSGDGAGSTTPGSFVTSGTILLGSFGSTIMIRFYGTSGYGPDLFIDNVTVKDMPRVTSNDDVLFSEVCDNMSGQAENTGFIELFNKQDYMINLSGDMINMGDAGVYGDYTFTFPSGTYIQPLGYIVVANGATLGDFNTAWSKSLTSDQFFTDSGLALTSGKAYEYDNGSKAQIDTTPVVNSNSREVRKRDKTWDSSTTTNDGTPGSFGGSDEQLGALLVSFMANFQAHELTLTWAVSSQNNISQWNIYRSSEDNFVTASKIGSINVQGEDVGMHEYSFTDNSGFNYVNNQTYYFWIESVDLSGTSELLGNTSITINENENHDAPVLIRYGVRNYPNPFNPSTKIEFAVKESGKATLYIYNVKGQLVKKADQGYINADKVYSYIWDGTDMNNKHVANGLYLYKLVTPKKTYTKKMIMLK